MRLAKFTSPSGCDWRLLRRLRCERRRPRPLTVTEGRDPGARLDQNDFILVAVQMRPARNTLRSGAGHNAGGGSVRNADLVPRPNGSFGQDGAVDPGLAFMLASQQPHDLGVGPCGVG